MSAHPAPFFPSHPDEHKEQDRSDSRQRKQDHQRDQPQGNPDSRNPAQPLVRQQHKEHAPPGFAKQRHGLTRQQIARLCGNARLTVELPLRIVPGMFLTYRERLKPCRVTICHHLTGMNQIVNQFGWQWLVEFRPQRVDRPIRSGQASACALACFQKRFEAVVSTLHGNIAGTAQNHRSPGYQPGFRISHRCHQTPHRVRPEVRVHIGEYENARKSLHSQIVQHQCFAGTLPALHQMNAGVSHSPHHISSTVSGSIRSDPHVQTVWWIIQRIKIENFVPDTALFVERAHENGDARQFLFRPFAASGNATQQTQDHRVKNIGPRQAQHRNCQQPSHRTHLRASQFSSTSKYHNCTGAFP